MKNPFSIKQWILLFISIILAAFMLSWVTVAMVVYSNSGADWVSSLIETIGNVLGGVIGGIVAIIVAAYQVSKALRNEHNKQLKTSSTMLKLIREELLHNVSTIQSAIPYENNCFSLLKTQLSEDTWKSAVIHLVISDELLVRLNVLYRKVSLIRSLDPSDIDDELLKDTKEQITILLEEVRKEINDLEAILNK